MNPRHRKKRCFQVEPLEGRIALRAVADGPAPPAHVQPPPSQPQHHDQLKEGDSGNTVVLLQTDLKELGYDLGTFGKNHNGIDGRFGPVTLRAVKAFQKSHYEIRQGQPDPRHPLKVDGIVGPKTWASLDVAVATFIRTGHR